MASYGTKFIANPNNNNDNNPFPLSINGDEPDETTKLLQSPLYHIEEVTKQHGNGKDKENDSDTNGGRERSEGSFLNTNNPGNWLTLKTLMKISWPVIVTFILELLPSSVNVMAVGRLGENELASVSLANLFCNVTGYTVGMGIATAMDTLCSQVYGANNKKGLGVILQRALLIEFVISLPICILWYFSEPVLLLLGQDEKVAELAGTYCKVMIFGLYPLFVYEVLKKYLQAQGIVLPQMFIAIVGNLWTVLANWLFVYYFSFGYMGAPIARMSTNICFALFTIIYVAFKKDEGTWEGWSLECLSNWTQFLVLGVPGMLMMCVEWWSFEFLAIFAGLLGTTELAAQAVLYNVVVLTYFVPYGISVAASILIGNSLGKGWDFSAKKVARYTLYLAVGAEIVNGISLTVLRDYLSLLFTNDPEVIELASSIFPIAAGYQLFDGLATVSGGILRGCGKQKIGALIYFFGYMLFGLPVSAALAFKTDMGLFGMWLGFAM